MTNQQWPDERHEFVAELKISDLLANIRDTIGKLHNLATAKVLLGNEMAGRQRVLDNIKSEVVARGVAGSSEKQRDATLAIALSESQEYSALSSELHRSEDQARLYDVDIEHLRNTLSAYKLQGRLLAATLEYLGGER